MSDAPTFLGRVGGVSGASVHVYLASSVSSGLPILGGTTYRIGQVASFIRIPQGYQDLYGIVTDVGANALPPNTEATLDSGRWLKAQLLGEALGGAFERGISQYPNVNDDVHMVIDDDLLKIYGSHGLGQVPIGRLSSSENISVCLDIDRVVTRHSAVLGWTGSGSQLLWRVY